MRPGGAAEPAEEPTGKYYFSPGREMFSSSALLRNVYVCPEGSFVATADLLGDGVHRIGFVSDFSLGVYSGGRVIVSYPLADAPLALTTMRLPQFSPPREFFVILFSRYVGVYGVLRPTPMAAFTGALDIAPVARYTLSLGQEMSAGEAAALSRYLTRETTSKQAAEELRALGAQMAQDGRVLSDLSQRFLNLPDPEDGPGEAEGAQYPSLQATEALGMWDQPGLSGLSGLALAGGGAAAGPTDSAAQRGLGQASGAPPAPLPNLNRARLLDGLTPSMLSSVPDNFACMAPLKMVGRTQDSTCLVLCTAAGKLLVLGSDISTVILTVELPQPGTQIFLEGQASEAQGVQDGTWRATILGREGLVMSLRGGNLSKNLISLESLPHFVARIGNNVYCITNSPRPCSVVRMTPRGRVDYSHSLPSAFACGCQVDVVHGKPFRGFVFGLHDASLVFFNANGPTTVAPLHYAEGEEDEGERGGQRGAGGAGAPGAAAPALSEASGSRAGESASTSNGASDGSGRSVRPGASGKLDSAGDSADPEDPAGPDSPPLYFKHIYFGRVGESDDALVCVRSDGSVVLCTLCPGYDLNRPQDHGAGLEPGPFDVEDEDTFGGRAGALPGIFPPDSVETQREQFEAFLASRAFAKATVLGELVEAERKPEKHSTPSLPSGLSYSADVALSTNLVTLILTAANPTARPSAPAAVSISSGVLRPDDGAVLVPALPPGGSAVRHFALRPRKLTGEARVVRAHSVYVLAAPPGAPEGCRPEAVLEVAVPEFLVA